jgi:hypothetical protein
VYKYLLLVPFEWNLLLLCTITVKSQLVQHRVYPIHCTLVCTDVVLTLQVSERWVHCAFRHDVDDERVRSASRSLGGDQVHPLGAEGVN